jgi:hypothetical protein
MDWQRDLDGNPYTFFFTSGSYNPVGCDAYKTKFFGFGNTYYTDINLEFSKKISKDFSLTATYMYQVYNKMAVEGKIDLRLPLSDAVIASMDANVIKSHIAIAELKYKVSGNFSLRGELQYLLKQSEGKYDQKLNKDDWGDWAYVLLEASLFQNLMVFASDMYNFGKSDLHYYNGGLAYNVGTHRIQVSYGRTKAGYNCSGGVCRQVPAYKGVQISYNMNF